MRHGTLRGLLLLLLLAAGGHAIRHGLMLGPDGDWRDPAWLDRWLPPPAAATAGATTRQTRPAVSPDRPLAVNTAPAESLVALPGVGPVLAARIVAERERGGPFRDAADLVRVRGIGPRTAARLAPLLRFATAPVPAPGDSSVAPTGR